MGIRAAAGEWRSQQLSANAGLGDTANGVTVTAAQNASRGYNAIVNKADYGYNPDRDGYRFSTVQLNGNWSPSSTLKFALHALKREATSSTTVMQCTMIAFVRWSTTALLRTADFSLTSNWTGSLRIGSSTDKSSFESAFPGDYRTRNDLLGWQNNFRVSSALNLLGAFEWRRETVQGSDALPR